MKNECAFKGKIPALIFPSPRHLPLSVVMIIVNELVIGTAIDKSTESILIHMLRVHYFTSYYFLYLVNTINI